MPTANKDNSFRSGFVVILGRPNVGKSTLLNTLVESKVSIVSAIPQTTRHQIRGVLNLKNAQAVFVDTPGIHSFKDSLSSQLNLVAKKSIEGCDLIIYLVDVSRRPGLEEKEVVKIITAQKIKALMVLNKIDRGVKFLNDYISLWQEGKNTSPENLIYYIPLSAKTGKNLDKLKTAIIENLPAGPKYYDTKTLTDFPDKFRVADIIREKLFRKLDKELPHSLAVEVAEIKDKKKVVYIKANIYVKRNSQKRIVVGKNGESLKTVGVQARSELEKMYDKKVFLDIWVTVLKDWPERPRIIEQLGYSAE
ncbi:MAG: GTPase Era [Candidatus Omnitrophica bacterium]|nr:GTPase Era [Candidatus Omnitrophota bacterium]MBU2044267.1 GTPase Era [Candidatus Omnitrophota bacterium]MBU2474056.1 GTPase Era [Candidatus Omnitrophota bacterium]